MDEYKLTIIVFTSLMTIIWLLLSYIGGRLDLKLSQVNSTDRNRTSIRTQVQPKKINQFVRDIKYERVLSSTQKTIEYNQETVEIQRQFESQDQSQGISPFNEIDSSIKDVVNQFDRNDHISPKNEKIVKKSKYCHSKQQEIDSTIAEQSPSSTNNQIVDFSYFAKNFRSTKNINIDPVLKTVQEIMEDYSPIRQESSSIQKIKIDSQESQIQSLKNINTTERQSTKVNPSYFKTQLLEQNSDRGTIKRTTQIYRIPNRMKTRKQSRISPIEVREHISPFKDMSLTLTQNTPGVESSSSIKYFEPNTPGSPIDFLTKESKSKIHKQYNCKQIENVNIFLRILKKHNPRVNRSYKFTQLYIRYLEVQMFICLSLKFVIKKLLKKGLNQQTSDYLVWGISIILIMVKRVIDSQILKLIKKSNSLKYLKDQSVKGFVYFINFSEMFSSYGVIIWQINQNAQFEQWFFILLSATFFDFIVLDILIFIFYCVGLDENQDDVIVEQINQIAPE